MNPSVSTGHVAEFRRGWTIVFVSIIGIACGLSAISIYSIGAFTKPLSDAYGWSRAEVQGIYTFMLLGNLIAAPALGWIIDRCGVRRITLFSILASALGLAALGLFTNSLWGMYAVAFVTSVVGIATVPITWTRVIITWFQKNRGLALGLTLAGSGLSATFLPAYVTWLIDEFGWRYAYVGIAALPALIALPAAYFLLKDHNPYEQNTPDLAVEKTAQDTGIDLKQACSDYRFWIIIFVFVVIGGNISGLITHLIPILTDRGMNPTVAAQMAGTIGVAVIGGRVVTGFLLDRFWAPAVGVVVLALPALSCLILAGAGSGPAATIAAAIFIGIAAGAEFDFMSFLVSQYFGRRHYGMLYAVIYTAFTLAAGVSGPLFGLWFDEMQSYQGLLLIAAGLFIVAPLSLLFLGPYTAQLSEN